MTRNGYNLLAGLAIVGAVILAALERDLVTVASLVGLAGTIAGRGTNPED